MMLDVIQSILTIAATATGIYVALSGLHAWKRELKGRRDIELCQKVIENFYEAGQRFAELRSPFSFPDVESKDRPRNADETDKERELRDRVFVPLARLKDQSLFWREFFSLKFRVQALLGDDAAKQFEIIETELNEVRTMAVVRYRSIEGETILESVDSGEVLGVLVLSSQDDEMMQKIWDAVYAMEKICIPVVRSKPSTFEARLLVPFGKALGHWRPKDG